MHEPTERLQRLEQALHEQVHTWRLQPVVEALQALRGVQCTVAVTLVAELGDLTRFDNPRPLLSYVGLTPSEYSSGARRRQGSLTKTGNTQARRALVEGAWAYRYPAKVSRHLQRRLETLPKAVQDISWKAQVRLGTRDRKLSARGKHANQVVVAIARELLALMWAIAKEGPVIPYNAPIVLEQRSRASPRQGARPRYGVPLDGVTRPAGTLGPRVRQAPDGPKSGGRQPTDISVINRRMLLAPPLPMDSVKNWAPVLKT